MHSSAKQCLAPFTVNHLGTDWRWNLLRSYFDNNQSLPPALWHDVDNVIHVASHSDYLDPDPTCWEPDAPDGPA